MGPWLYLSIFPSSAELIRQPDLAEGFADPESQIVGWEWHYTL
jgi:hypothetical protein